MSTFQDTVMKSIKCIAFIFRVYKTETIVLRDCNGFSRPRVWVTCSTYERETDSEGGRKSIDIVRWWLMMTHSTHLIHHSQGSHMGRGDYWSLCSCFAWCVKLIPSPHPTQTSSTPRSFSELPTKRCIFQHFKKAFLLRYDVSAFPQKGFKRRK